jgi:hypothetical protein
LILFLLQTAFAGDDLAAPAESRATVVQPEVPAAGGLSFFGTFQARATASNLTSTNPFLDGQVIGDVGGTNGIVVDPATTSAYTEQRANGFFRYAPPMLSGKAGLTAAFEVDFAFGDRSYGTGGNTGGGFGADQVNLQTRRLHADFWHRGGHDVHAIVGLQFVGDSVSDPTTSTPDDLLRSGSRLMFFGSEAAGVAVYGRLHDAGGDVLRWRLGTFALVEQGLSSPDDAWLNVADVEVDPAYGVRAGLHAWYLQDRTEGTGGALGLGPTSGLWEMQGGPKYDIFDGHEPPEDPEIFADLGWIGLDGAYNAGLTLDDFGVSGAAFLNVGRLYAPIAHDDLVRGALFDVEGRWRWNQGKGSVARAEVLVSSGDSADPDTYSGVVTGNAYGVAGAFYATHGTLLLFPDPRSINRMTPVLTDVSGRGQGIRALTASFGYDPIPDRLNVTLGGGTATNAAGEAWGSEINAKISYEPMPLLEFAAYGAYLAPGSASGLTESPWAAYAAIDWLVL